MNIDKQIIIACKSGDRRAQFELFQLCFGFILAICLRYYKNHDDAKEVSNKIFHKVLLKIETYSTNNSFKAWVKRISVNTIIDEFRKQQRQKIQLELTGEALEIMPDSKSKIDSSQIDIEVLKKMIHSLPENQRLVFNLLVIDGHTHKECGKMLDLSVGTSKWLLHEARKTLQKKVTHYFNLKTKNYVKS